MDRAVKITLAELEAEAQRTTSGQMRQVGLAACSDVAIADALTEAFTAAGPDGIVSVSSGLGNATTVSVSEGMQIDRGYLSEKFITNPTEQTCELNDCYLLITDYKLAGMLQVLPLLEHVARAGKPLLVIADDIEGEVMQLLITNHLRGVLQCAAIRAPGFSNRRSSLLEDIAAVSGGKAITRDLGLAFDRLQLQDLGRAARIVVSSDATTIFGGFGPAEEVRKRIELLRREVGRTRDATEREKLQQRLGNMAGRFATVHVARPTPFEADDAKYRAQSAMHSMRGAVEGGFTVGGGIGLLKAGSRLATVNWLSDSERAGAEVVARALHAPAAALAEAGGQGNIDPIGPNTGIKAQ